MKKTILILGATGRLGRAAATAFADAGWSVRAQSRKPLPHDVAARASVVAVSCDALDTARLRQAAEGAQVVLHALNPLYTQWDRWALPLADAAIDAAKHANALLMLPGNVYNFGRELPPVLSTHTPERGDTPKARTRIEIERRMATAAGLDSVVIRAGDFFGGVGPGTWLDMAIASRIASGRFVDPGAADLLHAWAYLPDLARAFVRVAARREELHGHHRAHFAGHGITGSELQQALEAASGSPLRRASFPWWAIGLASPVMPMWRELFAMRYLWQRPHRLDGESLHALIGDVSATPLHDAVHAALVDSGLLEASAQSSRFSASARA